MLFYSRSLDTRSTVTITCDECYIITCITTENYGFGCSFCCNLACECIQVFCVQSVCWLTNIVSLPLLNQRTSKACTHYIVTYSVQYSSHEVLPGFSFSVLCDSYSYSSSQCCRPEFGQTGPSQLFCCCTPLSVTQLEPCIINMHLLDRYYLQFKWHSCD